jgi:hypothetical protein
MRTSFFESPQSTAGHDLVATGSCSEPSPGADVEDLDIAAVTRLQRPPDGKPVASASSGPRGFVWLLPGKLAGTAQPDVVADQQRDLEALRRVGVSDLICLTETAPQAPLLARHGLVAHGFPIPDARPPGMQQAHEICLRIDALLGQGAVVAALLHGVHRVWRFKLLSQLSCGPPAGPALTRRMRAAGWRAPGEGRVRAHAHVEALGCPLRLSCREISAGSGSLALLTGDSPLSSIGRPSGGIAWIRPPWPSQRTARRLLHHSMRRDGPSSDADPGDKSAPGLAPTTLGAVLPSHVTSSQPLEPGKL